MPSRRQFIQFALTISFAQLAKANNIQLGLPSQLGVPRKAWVANPQVVKQQCQSWCWAASIAMIFDSHGHPLDQQTIVQATFGGQVCAGASNTLTMAQNLSRSWVDNNGNTFTSVVTAAYDPQNGINNLTNDYIVSQLSNNQPLLYANKHHAMYLLQSIILTPCLALNRLLLES